MKNKSKKMYGKLSALLLSVVLIMTGLSVTVAAEAVNLIDAFDPTFDSYVPAGTTPIPAGKVVLPANNTLFTLQGATLDTSGGNDASDSCIAMTKVGDAICFIAPIEPAKNYNFSFWMRNSKEKALQLQGGASYSAFINDPCEHYDNGGKTSLHRYCVIANGGNLDWDWKNNQYNAYIGVDPLNQNKNLNYYNADEYTFGVARDENAANDWRQVTINFSTPPYGVTHVRFYLACVAENGDDKLAIDDLAVVETGEKPNRVFNGSFEAIRYDKNVPEVSGISYNLEESGNTADVTLETDPQTNNTYLKINCAVNNPDRYRMNWHPYSKTAAFMQGKKAGTRYKLSYKAKAIDLGAAVGTKGTAFYFTGVNSSDCDEVYMGQYTNEWKNYTLYFDATQLAKNAKALYTYTTQFGYYTDSEYTLYLDDLYSWYDESNIGFYKTLDFNYESGSQDDRYIDFEPANNKYSDIIMTESSVEATSLSALTPDGSGNRTVKVRAHYLPEATWGSEVWEATTVSFDETTVTLLAAVYKYETKNGVETKTLVDVKTANGTSSENGETIDVVTEVSVPGNAAGVRYAVEAVALNMSSLKPIVEKAELW